MSDAPSTAVYYAIRQANPDHYLPDCVPESFDAERCVALARDHEDDAYALPEVSEGGGYRFASRVGYAPAVDFLRNVCTYWLRSCRKPESHTVAACLEVSFGDPTEPAEADSAAVAARKRRGINLHMHMLVSMISGGSAQPKVNFRSVQGAFPHAHIDPPRKFGSRDRFRHYIRKDTAADCAKWRTSVAWVERGNFPDEEPARLPRPLERAREMLEAGATPRQIKASGIEFNFGSLPKAIDSYYFALNYAEVLTSNREVRCTWHYGEPGTSKTYSALRHLHDAYGVEDVFKADGFKNAFDTYAAEKHILLNDLAPQRGIIKPLLSMLDPYPYLIPCRYQDRPLAVRGDDAVCVTSVLDPLRWMLNLPENAESDRSLDHGRLPEPPAQLIRRLHDVVFHFVADEALPIDDPNRYGCASTSEMGVAPIDMYKEGLGFSALERVARRKVVYR